MRRTKEEAARTRSAIVDAALACFDRHGIGGTTLDHIAERAGVTKGAIYWHFSGKREILHAIRDEVSLPLLDQADTGVLHGTDHPPLERIQRFLEAIIDSMERDRRKRTAMTVMQFKCEYVDDLAAELRGSVRKNKRLVAAFEGAYAQARASGTLVSCLTPRVAALDTLAFLAGLLRLWLLDAGREGIRGEARTLIRAHIGARRRG